ncbi:pathogenesis-related protein 1-like protein [Dinothrombium tinctorium]|uniref:Pathogenesis-related protein 1-like protein n=1 Tax=Dinothrombium tinctorium TaxID=1965070 RepID=A0A443QM43_9ACAR|nr:pathogenesis-related protein 1-like protein [Dinothrombium tinctorium]
MFYLLVVNEEEAKPGLVTDLDLVTFAQKRANELSEKCGFDHEGNKGSGYGENLAAGYRTCEKVVDAWYNEKKDYTEPKFTPKVGHYTQLIWKSTKKIGCATAPHCKFGSVTVCNYYPPGNMYGQFEENAPVKSRKKFREV